MNTLSKERAGELVVISHAVLASLFPVLGKIILTGLTPISSLAWSMLFAFIFFLGVMLIKNSWPKISDKNIVAPLIGTVLIFGVIFPTLQFIGLKYTSAGNAGLILAFEVFFTFIFFNIWRKEFIGHKHIWGGVLMLVSAVIILIPNFSEFKSGDFIILGAVMIPPLGNLFQKRVREKISSEAIMFSRTLVAVPVLFLLAYFFGENSIPQTTNIWIALFVSGFVYFGVSKILWIEGIHRISVTKASALNSLTPAFTILFAFLVIDNAPTMSQILALPLTILGVYLLTRPA